LAARGVLDRMLADRVASAASLRNRIAHGYVSVEHERSTPASTVPDDLTTEAGRVGRGAAWRDSARNRAARHWPPPCSSINSAPF
jgi:hypothetical protein